MRKSKHIFIIILLLIVENVVLWYAANFYYQYQTQERRAESKKGQAEVCKTIPINSDLLFVLERMDQYSLDLININSRGQIDLSYGSEAKGFVTSAGVSFIFDQNYRLTHKSCSAKWEPETPAF